MLINNILRAICTTPLNGGLNISWTEVNNYFNLLELDRNMVSKITYDHRSRLNLPNFDLNGYQLFQRSRRESISDEDIVYQSYTLGLDYSHQLMKEYQSYLRNIIMELLGINLPKKYWDNYYTLVFKDLEFEGKIINKIMATTSVCPILLNVDKHTLVLHLYGLWTKRTKLEVGIIRNCYPLDYYKIRYFLFQNRVKFPIQEISASEIAHRHYIYAKSQNRSLFHQGTQQFYDGYQNNDRKSLKIMKQRQSNPYKSFEKEGIYTFWIDVCLLDYLEDIGLNEAFRRMLYDLWMFPIETVTYPQEIDIARKLAISGVKLMIDDQLKLLHIRSTPDILFLSPVLLNGKEINWIEFKCVSSVNEKIIEQIAKYAITIGPGAVAFEQGFTSEDRALLEDGLLRHQAKYPVYLLDVS